MTDLNPVLRLGAASQIPLDDVLHVPGHVGRRQRGQGLPRQSGLQLHQPEPGPRGPLGERGQGQAQVQQRLEGEQQADNVAVGGLAQVVEGGGLEVVSGVIVAYLANNHVFLQVRIISILIHHSHDSLPRPFPH